VERFFLVVGLILYVSPAESAQELKFDCAGKMQHGTVPLNQWPDISGAELRIDLAKKQLLLTTPRPIGAIYGKIVEMTDLLIRFRTPDGRYGGIDRTSGEFMVSNMWTETTYWLKCNLRKQLF
jgi:hypothetical protein